MSFVDINATWALIRAMHGSQWTRGILSRGSSWDDNRCDATCPDLHSKKFSAGPPVNVIPNLDSKKSKRPRCATELPEGYPSSMKWSFHLAKVGEFEYL
jgi:hypothetical protein